MRITHLNRDENFHLIYVFEGIRHPSIKVNLFSTGTGSARIFEKRISMKMTNMKQMMRTMGMMEHDDS